MSIYDLPKSLVESVEQTLSEQMISLSDKSIPTGYIKDWNKLIQDVTRVMGPRYVVNFRGVMGSPFLTIYGAHPSMNIPQNSPVYLSFGMNFPMNPEDVYKMERFSWEMNQGAKVLRFRRIDGFYVEQANDKLVAWLSSHKSQIDDLLTPKMDPNTRRAYSDVAGRLGLDGNGRFESQGQAVSAIHTALDKVGLSMSEVVTGDILLGDKGHRMFRIAKQLMRVDADWWPEYEDSMVVFVWEKLENGYEVISYLS